MLDRPHQQLGDQRALVVGLVRDVSRAPGMMQVHLPQRPLERVLLPLLAAMPGHQLGELQIVPRHQYHGVDRHQLPAAVLLVPAHHHVGLHATPPARLVGYEGRPLELVDGLPVRLLQNLLHRLQDRPLGGARRHADRIVPAPILEVLHDVLAVVGVVHAPPHRNSP